MSSNVKCVVIQTRRIKRIRIRRIINGGVDHHRRVTVDRALLPGHRRRRTAAAAHHHGQVAAAARRGQVAAAEAVVAAVAEAAVAVKITK